MNVTMSYQNDVWSLTFSEWLNALPCAQYEMMHGTKNYNACYSLTQCKKATYLSRQRQKCITHLRFMIHQEKKSMKPGLMIFMTKSGKTGLHSL
jgi:hypothetical protein